MLSRRLSVTILLLSGRRRVFAMDDGRPGGRRRVFGKPTHIVRRIKPHNTYRDWGWQRIAGHGSRKNNSVITSTADEISCDLFSSLDDNDTIVIITLLWAEEGARPSSTKKTTTTIFRCGPRGNIIIITKMPKKKKKCAQ